MCRLGGVVGLSWPSAPQNVILTPAQVREFSRCKKSTASISYYYAACKRSLEYLFGLGALDKIKFLEQVRISSELRCLLLGRKLSIKITCGNWYRQDGATLKSETSSEGMHWICIGTNINPQPHWGKKTVSMKLSEVKFFQILY
ncbi:hypothetical protein TNCV_1691641 [Trichonephila clavipes]|nr:hypothetical protein TNCV_1691641 [Trichonephila clavipes]